MSIARDTTIAAGAFGLSDAPFEAGPDPRFIYAHEGLRKVCAELLAFDLSEQPGLFLILGAPGSGKSTLLQKVLEDRRFGAHCLALSGAGELSFEVLIQAWCAALGIAKRATDHGARRAAVLAHLAARGSQGETVALLLDDAEDLADDVLHEFCEFAASDVAEHRLARIVLAGRPELESKLADPERPALRRAVAVQTHLEAMAEPEVEAYIRHRLAAAGHEAPQTLFSAQAVEIVARASLGVPRLINILCRAALAIAAGNGRPTVSAEQVEAAIQTCLANAQDSLAAQDLPRPGIAAAHRGPVALAGPAPPRPVIRWPIVAASNAAASGATRAGAAARPVRPNRLARSALRLVAGLGLGLAVVILSPARLEPPAAVTPGLLLTAGDDKLQALEAGPTVPAQDRPAEARSRTLAAAPAGEAPRPPVKPQLLSVRGGAPETREPAALAPPAREARKTVQDRKRDREPASWLDRVVDFFTSREPSETPPPFGRHADR